MKNRILRLPIILTLIALALLLVAGLVLPWIAILHWPLGDPAPGNLADIRIKYGTSPDSIATLLQREEVISSASRFRWALKLTGKGGALRAGHFRIPRPLSNRKAIYALTDGPQILTRVTIPEGFTARKIAGLFQQKMEIDSLRFMQLTRDSSFIARFDIDSKNLEGYLFPETYHFPYGANEAQLITPLVQQFKKVIWDTLYARSQEMGFTTHEMVTLASIVQAEARLIREMPTIASVYHNRLRLGIPLQADPTIQYILPDGPRRLLYRDLELESPYNTYLFRGLPPGPIGNPGQAALLATLRPEATSYLFFVADTKGGHTFSTNFRRHLNAKSVLDRERIRVSKLRR